VRRLAAPGEDGVWIPITVLMRKGQQLDGGAPLYLYGYGSYGGTVNAEFSSAGIAAVEQGWIYAIAHVRGAAAAAYPALLALAAWPTTGSRSGSRSSSPSMHAG
jgi:protease II